MSDTGKIYFLARPLPEALTHSDSFKDLPAEQINNFRGRIRYIEEMTRKIEEWVNNPQLEFREYLDDIELDVLVNQGAPRGDTVVSAWLVHTSWTFGTTAQQLRELLSPTILSALDSIVPSSSCSPEELVVWLGEQGAVIKKTLDHFYSAEDYPKAIAGLIALDVLMGTLLLATYRARLNPVLPR